MCRRTQELQDTDVKVRARMRNMDHKKATYVVTREASVLIQEHEKDKLIRAFSGSNVRVLFDSQSNTEASECRQTRVTVTLEAHRASRRETSYASNKCTWVNLSSAQLLAIETAGLYAGTTAPSSTMRNVRLHVCQFTEQSRRFMKSMDNSGHLSLFRPR